MSCRPNPYGHKPRPGSGLSRRRLLQLGQGAVTALLMPSSARAGQAPWDPAGDDALLARLVAQDRPHIPRRATPYKVTRPLHIASGTTLTIEQGTHFLCALPSSTLVAVFEAAGDDVAIRVEPDGEAIVECLEPNPSVYTAAVRGHAGFTVAGLLARECQHVLVTAGVDEYGRIRVGGTAPNVARSVTIRGGGAVYRAPQQAGQGACLLSYVDGCTVSGARYTNVPHGVEWWGGNADPVRPPAQGGAGFERKCRDLRINNVLVRNAAGGGIWGSMGADVVVSDCQVDGCGDVAFDAEGSNAVLFERCVARNARNGCFTTFFLCDGVRFLHCQGTVDDKAFPLVRIYNSTLDTTDNRSVEIEGGRFECRDQTGPSTIDTAMGPVRSFSLVGAALVNVRVDTAFSNMHRTRIANNDLVFPHRLKGVAAIRAGSSKIVRSAGAAVPGTVTIENNRIRYTAQDGSGATAISLREDDYNGSADDRVRGNTISGPFEVGIAVSNATANPGIVPSFTVTGNRFAGLPRSARLLAVEQEGRAPRPSVSWSGQTRDGRPASPPGP